MQIQAATKDAYELFHKGVLALARAERQGIRVDTVYCEQQKKEITKKIEEQEAQLANTNLYKRWKHIYGAKTNIYSNHQLSNLLYKHMKIEPPKTTDSGEGATDEDALKNLGLPELNLILQARKLAKIRDTYLESFIRETNIDGYMRPFFNLHLVKTYRSSSADPNFQNIPKRDKEAMRICRGAIYPRPGHVLVEADFSSLEVMISACYHKDPTMLKYLRDKSSDMHADMAKQIFHLPSLDKSIPAHSRLRNAAKNGFVFPQFYGDYYVNNALSLCDWVGLPTSKKWTSDTGILLPNQLNIAAHLRQYGIRNFEQFVAHMKQVEDDFWNRRFRVYKQWRETWVKQYRKKGYLRMFTGFTCSGVMRKNEIFNYPVQGTAFHCLLKTFIKMDEVMYREKWASKLVGQIHDSVLIDAQPQELDYIKEELNKIVKELPVVWPWIIVPLEIDVEVYNIDGPWIK